MTAQTPPLSTAVAHNGRLAGKRVLITGTGGGQGA
jgi:meso-butanediol dehydrogenase / (S,S)-butanediol dehydrogenase / diacetyl reductase